MVIFADMAQKKRSGQADRRNVPRHFLRNIFFNGFSDTRFVSVPPHFGHGTAMDSEVAFNSMTGASNT